MAKSCEAGKVRATPFRFYPRWQTDFDDRGVVWMRFGGAGRSGSARIRRAGCKGADPFETGRHSGAVHPEMEVKPGEARRDLALRDR